MSILNMLAFFIHPDFYDGFSLRAEVSIRLSALVAFQLQEVSPDLVLSRAAVEDGAAIKNNLLTTTHRRLIGGHIAVEVWRESMDYW